MLPFELYMSLRRIYFGADALKTPEELLNNKPANEKAIENLENRIQASEGGENSL